MQAGTVVAGRFRIERIAGRGGTGTVYRARDVQTGEQAAVKIALLSSSEDLTRFTRETQLLAELHHPGIVRYVAHGTTDTGERFLAMEWIEGEDLSTRLVFDKLRVDEAMELMRRVAEALA